MKNQGYQSATLYDHLPINEKINVKGNDENKAKFYGNHNANCHDRLSYYYGFFMSKFRSSHLLQYHKIQRKNPYFGYYEIS
jgi:hypothetical protein